MKVMRKSTSWRFQPSANASRSLIATVSTDHEIVPNPMEIAVDRDRTVHLPSNSILIRRDGFEIPIEDSVAPIHDRKEQATGAVIVFRDVSAARAMALLEAPPQSSPEAFAEAAKARTPYRRTSSTLALTGEQRDEVLWLAVQIATWRGEGRPEQWIKRKLAGFRAATARTRLCERLGVLLSELERPDDEPTPELIAFVQQKVDTGFSRAQIARSFVPGSDCEPIGTERVAIAYRSIRAARQRARMGLPPVAHISRRQAKMAEVRRIHAKLDAPVLQHFALGLVDDGADARDLRALGMKPRSARRLLKDAKGNIRATRRPSASAIAKRLMGHGESAETVCSFLGSMMSPGAAKRFVRRYKPSDDKPPTQT